MQDLDLEPVQDLDLDLELEQELVQDLDPDLLQNLVKRKVYGGDHESCENTYSARKWKINPNLKYPVLLGHVQSLQCDSYKGMGKTRFRI